MPQPSPVADHLDALTRALQFDPALARRVRREAEDHLREASEPDGAPCVETERRAVAVFGEPQALARQFAATALLAQTRRLGATTMLALAGIFIAMQGRIAWYGLMQWGVSEELKSINAIGLPLDRWAFFAALAGALAACAYIATRRAPAEFDRAYGQELRRGVVLCTAAAAALASVVAIETVLTACRLLVAEFTAAALVPALSLATELALAGALVLHIHAAFRRARCAASLLEE